MKTFTLKLSLVFCSLLFSFHVFAETTPLAVYDMPEVPNCSSARCNLSLMVEGGTPPYEINISPYPGPYSTYLSGPTRLDFMDILSGPYDITVTDSSTPTETATLNIFTVSHYLTANSIFTPTECSYYPNILNVYIQKEDFAAPDGLYEYQLNGAGSWTSIYKFDNIYDLPSGNNSIVIRDAQYGCEAVAMIVPVENPTAINVSGQFLHSPGAPNDSIVLAMSGGTPPYECRLNNGAYFPIQDGDTIKNVPHGLDSIFIRDANYCTTDTLVFDCTGLPTSIGEGKNTKLLALGVQSAIQLSGAMGEHVEVYDINGTLVYSGLVAVENEKVFVPKRGYYIVRLASSSVKVLVK